MNSSSVEIPQLALTVPQAAARLAVCRRTIERLVAVGQLRVLKIGRSTRIEVTELVRYLESLRGPDTRQP
jgi:excisionase family DNA binding protein